MAIIIMLLDLVLSAWPSIYGGQSLEMVILSFPVSRASAILCKTYETILL